MDMLIDCFSPFLLEINTATSEEHADLFLEHADSLVTGPPNSAYVLPRERQQHPWNKSQHSEWICIRRPRNFAIQHQLLL